LKDYSANFHFGTRIAPPLHRGRGGTKKSVDIGSGFVVFIEGSVSAATAAGGQIADLESEIQVLRKRRSVMKLQRTFSCIAGVLVAVGFAASQAGAGGGNGLCDFEIEVNALRAGAKTVNTGPNQTTNVTAKARILKGTAASGTTIDTQLIIETVTGGSIISTNSTGPITLGVGKGGKGAKLSMATTDCVDGFIEFNARFEGTDTDTDFCIGERSVRKACQ
jgi:hypothetical protein